MRNIKLTIQYDGTNYAGWQFQKNAKSIQEVLERALRKILGEKVRLIGASRTDSGVHAKGQVANFKTRSELPAKTIQKALNSILAKDIVISDIEETNPKFNSQFDARTKLYRYTIATGDYLEPFIRKFAARYPYKLDRSSMQMGAEYLVGKQDFNSFQTKAKKDGNTIRTIRKIEIEKNGQLLYIDIEADGFLYNMVRNIVGTLVEVGRGKILADKVEEILLKKDRKFSGPTAPAKGLCLMKIEY